MAVVDEIGSERRGGVRDRPGLGGEGRMAHPVGHAEVVHDLRLALRGRDRSSSPVQTLEFEEERIEQHFLRSGAAVRRAGAGLLGLGVLGEQGDQARDGCAKTIE